MNFEQRFAEFVQSNPQLAAPSDAKITLTLRQFKAAAKRFFEAGRESAPQPQEHISLFDAIFGKSNLN